MSSYSIVTFLTAASYCLPGFGIPEEKEKQLRPFLLTIDLVFFKTWQAFTSRGNFNLPPYVGRLGFLLDR